MTQADRSPITQQAFADKLRDDASIQGIVLEDADLRIVEAYNVTLRDCTFKNVDFSDAALEGLHCVGVKFSNCSFIRTTLDDAVFENCTFYDPDIPRPPRESRELHPPGGCRFTKAFLRAARFTDCDLSFCIFENAEVFQLTLKGCKAIAADFRRAQFKNAATLVNNVMHHAQLRGVELSKCDISKTDFQWADLNEANFSEAILVGANLSSAEVAYTNFAHADLRAANISSFDIRAMTIDGASIYESQMQQLIENCGLVVFPDGR